MFALFSASPSCTVEFASSFCCFGFGSGFGDLGKDGLDKAAILVRVIVLGGEEECEMRFDKVLCGNGALPVVLGGEEELSGLDCSGSVTGAEFSAFSICRGRLIFSLVMQ